MAVLPRLRGLFLGLFQGETLNGGGLTPPHFLTLRKVHEGCRRPSDLARALSVSLPTVSEFVDSLVVKGLLIREPDASDRRQLLLTLTDAGIQMYARHCAALERQLAQALQVLEPERLERLGAALAELDQALEALATQTPQPTNASS